MLRKLTYGLVTPSEIDGTPTPAKKPTRFLTSSHAMVNQLSKKCKGDHAHQHLVGGRCAAAAFYPLPLVRAILRGMTDTAIIENKADQEETDFMNMMNALRTGGGSFPLEPKLPEVVMPSDDVRTSKIKKTSGGYLSIAYDYFKAMYTDEYTGEMLPGHLARAAMIDELDYFNEHVWPVEKLENGQTGS